MFYSKKKEESVEPTALQELQNAVDRMEVLLTKTKTTYANAKSSPSKKKGKNIDTAPKEKHNMKPKYIPMDKGTEEELVELIRRVSELVVRGEKYSENWKPGVSVENAEEEKMDVDIKKKSEELDTHLAVFEYFCEKNVLGLFVNIITGNAFTETNYESDDKSTNETDEESTQLLLPPISIATQGVQSVSILVQNVSRATSLYFLLSNNWINELISFSLEKYSDALDGSSKSQPSAAEIAELGTYFISFLKSLAMRMNAETLQFFLEYKSGIPQSDGKAMGDDDNMTAPNEETKCEQDESATDLFFNLEVDFPLYARALQFCSPYQDSFVRLTAMNICLNTIRLATVENSSSSNESEVFEHLSIFRNEKSTDSNESNAEGADSSSRTMETSESSTVLETEKDANESITAQNQEKTSPLTGIKYSSPDGTLVNVDLPTRERLAIAHHVCTPSRVQALVSPMFIQLTHLCGDLMDMMRELENLELDYDQDDYEFQREKLSSNIESIVADLQNELMFLDDLLEVGLTSLNEQTVEMMLATFIYPSLLQPLKVFLQRQPFLGTDESFYYESKIDNSTKSSSDDESLPKDEDTSPPPNTTETNNTSNSSTSLSTFPFKDIPTSLPKSDSLVENNAFQNSDIIFPTEERPDVYVDSSSPRAAFIALITVLFTVKNRRVVYFVLTALFHPLAPKSSGGIIMKQKPNIIYIQDDEVRIKVDPNSSDTDSFNLRQMISAFCDVNNNVDSNDYVHNDGNEEDCVFSLSPALANILTIGGNNKIELADNSGLRNNPYRQAFISCLSGTDGMVPLRRLAVYAIDAAILALDGIGVQSIFCGSINLKEGIGVKGEKKESASNTSNLPDLVSPLSSCVMTASICLNGFWKFEYNSTAAHALLQIIHKNESAKQKVTKLIEFRTWQSSAYIAQLPSILSSKFIESTEVATPSRIRLDDDYFNVTIDKMFRDPCDTTSKCALDYIKLDKANETFWAEVSKRSCMGESVSYICDEPGSENRPMEGIYDVPLWNAAMSAFAHLKLHSFYMELKKGIIDDDKINGSCFSVKSSIKREIYMALLDENPEEALPPAKAPHPGAVVTLVGRSAFPCVCEVTKECAHLFKDATSSVIANGVKWQSLYLVVIGRYMVLAEPEKSSGGNGLIVTCSLLSCISVHKDVEPLQSSSPARRLILTHSSLDETPPGLFVWGEKSENELFSSRKNQFYPHKQKSNAEESGRNMMVSHMDLWFEDGNASDAAFQTLVARINKSRSRRGKLLRTALQFDKPK